MKVKMKITIVTPSYNQEEFIERTILSVLNQKWDFDLEYIIVDWKSTDKSVEIIKKYDEKIKLWDYKNNFNSIKYIWLSEKDKWQSDAINKWLKLATWDIVTFLNSDDTYIKWCLETIINELWNSDKKWCYWKCRIIDLKDREIRKYITMYKNIIWNKYSYSKLLTENFISQMTVFWKREVMDEVWYIDVNHHLCMDYEYWLRLWKIYTPIYIDKNLSNFRFYHTSKSGSMFSKQFKEELEVAEIYAEWNYKMSLFFHKFNYYKIVVIYKILGFLKI